MCGGLLNSQALSWAGGLSCNGSYAARMRHACPSLPPGSALKELGRSCCALEHPGLWELPAASSRDKGKTLKLWASLGKPLPTSGKWRRTKSSFPVSCSLLAPVDLGIWRGLLWPNSPSFSWRQILASEVRKSPSSCRPQRSALPREWDAASQLSDGIFQPSEAAASWPTCSAVLQESQGNKQLPLRFRKLSEQHPTCLGLHPTWLCYLQNKMVWWHNCLIQAGPRKEAWCGDAEGVNICSRSGFAKRCGELPC